jgi:predicted dehydrogenase
MVNVLIVGAGSIARVHAGSFKEIPDAKVIGVADVRLENARKIAEISGGKAYENFADGLDEADLVYILTPPSIRKEIALKVIAAGKHIVMEKPIAVNVQDAEEMVEAAKKKGVKFMVGFNHRFRKGFGRLKDIAQSGELGDIISIWSQRLGMGLPPQGYNWRTDPNLLCGMTVESLSHDIDMIRWIAGEIETVRAHISGSREEVPTFDDNASVVFTMSSGATASIHASWSSHIGRNSRGIIGKKGSALVEGPGLWDQVNFRWRTESMPHEMNEYINDRFDVKSNEFNAQSYDFDVTSYVKENRYFVDCVLKDLIPEVTGDDGLKALKVSQAILKSAKTQSVVSL